MSERGTLWEEARRYAQGNREAYFWKLERLAHAKLPAGRRWLALQGRCLCRRDRAFYARMADEGRRFCDPEGYSCPEGPARWP